jgi:hypothetical protein
MYPREWAEDKVKRQKETPSLLWRDFSPCKINATKFNREGIQIEVRKPRLDGALSLRSK